MPIWEVFACSTWCQVIFEEDVLLVSFISALLLKTCMFCRWTMIYCEIPSTLYITNKAGVIIYLFLSVRYQFCKNTTYLEHLRDLSTKKREKRERKGVIAPQGCCFWIKLNWTIRWQARSARRQPKASFRNALPKAHHLSKSRCLVCMVGGCPCSIYLSSDTRTVVAKLKRGALGIIPQSGPWRMFQQGASLQSGNGVARNSDTRHAKMTFVQ